MFRRLKRRLEAGRFPIHLGRGATPAEHPTMARLGAALFAAGGVLGLISLALPAEPDRDTPKLFGMVLLAFAAAGVNLLVQRRREPWIFDLLAMGGTLIVCAAIHFGGSSADFYRLFFFWIVLYSAYFFTWRRTALQVAVIAVAYAITLGLDDFAGTSSLAWVLAVSTLAVAAALVTTLRGRSERLLEHEREHVERLLALDRLKDELVATVSHELRTPLTSVYGAAQTLERPDLDDATRRRLVTLLSHESKRLAHLVEDVLLANRIDSGQLDLTVRAVDPREVAREVLEIARLTAPERVRLELESDDALPPVAADEERLRQVLLNLLDNAVKYSPDGGDVVVALSSRNATVRFEVRDPGLGIPAGEQAAIFDKFHRLDPAMRRGVGGTGLGLYVCRALVERMGGRIHVESAPGHGSTFSVELPAARER